MKIIISDIYYKGRHFDEVVIDMPQLTDYDESLDVRISEYIAECLDNLIE